MGTSFSEIYEKAVFKISAYDFLDTNKFVKELVLEKYLDSARIDLQPACEVDLSDRDVANKQFNNELSEEIQEILALGVAFYWLSAKTIRSDLLKNTIYHKDYTTFSPANLLKEIHALRKEIKKEFKGRIREYSYRNSGLDTLKV